MDCMVDQPSFFKTFSRGFTGHCPACGEGRLFWRYLKVRARCEACHHELGRYPADDGPAYFTILIVGHLMVAPLLIFPIIWQAPPIYVVPATLIPLAFITLALLPRVKGGFIALLYHIGLKDADAHLRTADAAE